jgi:hypothetical protein
MRGLALVLSVTKTGENLGAAATRFLILHRSNQRISTDSTLPFAACFPRGSMPDGGQGAPRLLKRRIASV